MTKIPLTSARATGTRHWEPTIQFCAALLCLASLAVGMVAAAEAEDSTLKYEEPKRLTGTIYEEHSAEQEMLFRFKRVATRTNGSLAVVSDYTNPDGSLAARERVHYRGDYLASYELEELQTGASGSAHIGTDPQDPTRSRIQFKYTAPGSNGAKERFERLRENTLISDMLAPFLVSRWEELMRGAKVSCRFVVVPRTETVGFTFSKHSETNWRGRPVVIIRMEPSSWLIRLIVQPLFFTFEKEGRRRCLQYTGRTTPKHKVGGEWRDLDAVTVFDWP